MGFCVTLLSSDPPPMDEKSLVIALKTGDRRAFDAVFNRYAPDIFHFSLDLTGNENEAGDILQETFIKLWESRVRIDPDGNIRNYLISIAKNRIFDILKHKVIERKYILNRTSVPSDSTEVENALNLDDLRSQLLAGFNRLTAQQREILTLKSDGMRNDEIALLLGISKRTVENHLSSAYKQLRSELSHLRDVFHLVWPLIICLL